MAFTLGLDIGTSKVAAVVIDSDRRTLISVGSEEAHAALPPKGEGFFEQDPSRILVAIKLALEQISKKHLSVVKAIGITGQMHGVLPWNSRSYAAGNLITWQDLRCNEENFIDELQEVTGDKKIRSGYGLASIAWLHKNNPKLLKPYDRVSTIHDYVAARICNINSAVTDCTNAQSWGLFDLCRCKWNDKMIELAKIPTSLVPEVRETGSVLGSLCQEFAALWRLPINIPVLLPIGDNQASLYSTFVNPDEELALTIGTAAQLSALVNSNFDVKDLDHPGMDIRPYIGGRYVAVAAALCGGQAHAWLVDTIRDWTNELGLASPDRDELFKQLDALAFGSLDSPLRISSSFLGERHDPDRRGFIKEIDIRNFTLGNVFAALSRGTMENLRFMLPEEIVKEKSRVVGSGNGLRRLRIAQAMVEQIFDMPLILKNTTEEAAQGAALLAAEI